MYINMETVNLSKAYTLTKTYEITSYRYRITNINLFQSIHGIILFLNSEGNTVCENSFNIYQEDYVNWGTDDNFIFEWIEKNIDNLIT